MPQNKIILIAGLTASGKSQLALDIACRLNAAAAEGGAAVSEGRAAAGRASAGALIINADSMQVYRDLRILTARPSAADEAKAPHCLYGFVPAAQRFSAGAWLQAVKALLNSPQAAGKTLIFVGGTGLYFRALLGGLAEIPPVGAAVRREGQALLAQGLPALYAALQKADKSGAARLQPNDAQRILRAWEVWRQTGKPLSFWQKTASPPSVNGAEALKIALLPPREEIYRRINSRAEAMMAEGAAEEAAALRAQQLSPQLPLMKAAGVPALCAYWAGELSLAEAVEKTKRETRNYAKRQRTWFTRQLGADWAVYESAAAAWRAWRGQSSAAAAAAAGKNPRRRRG